MVLVEELGIGGQLPEEQLLDLLIPGVFTNEVMAEQDAIGVGIHHEHRFASPIQRDGIGGFRADSLYGQQFFPEGLGVLLEKGLEIPALFPDGGEKPLEAFGLLVVLPGRSDFFGQHLQGQGFQGLKGEQPILAQCLEDHAHIAPAGVLGQHRTEHDLEGGFAGPPVLGPEMVEKTGMDFLNPIGHGCCATRKNQSVRMKRK